MTDKYTMCYGIVKGKMPTKEVRTINAKDYESAIRQIKRYAQGNYRDYHKESTLFHNGQVVGWVFRTDGKIVYVTKFVMQDIGLIPKSRN